MTITCYQCNKPMRLNVISRYHCDSCDVFADKDGWFENRLGRLPVDRDVLVDVKDANGRKIANGCWCADLYWDDIHHGKITHWRIHQPDQPKEKGMMTDIKDFKRGTVWTHPVDGMMTVIQPADRKGNVMFWTYERGMAENWSKLDALTPYVEKTLSLDRTVWVVATATDPNLMTQFPLSEPLAVIHIKGAVEKGRTKTYIVDLDTMEEA